MTPNVLLKSLLAWVLRVTRLQYWPVRVRSGLAAGARWTLFPWTSYWRGTQEPAMHRVIIQLGDIRGWSCWDLGAHFGIYCIGLARRVGPTGEVAAFEPNPLSYARLVRHCRMNGLAQTKLFKAAVSDITARGKLYTYGSLNTTTTHLPYDDETPGAPTKSLSVQTLSLDELVTSGRIRLPNLIKIDVEGHGHRALSGAIESIKSSRPIIIMGFHSAVELEVSRNLLEPLGYVFEPVDAEAPKDCVLADYLLRPASRH